MKIMMTIYYCQYYYYFVVGPSANVFFLFYNQKHITFIDNLKDKIHNGGPEVHQTGNKTYKIEPKKCRKINYKTQRGYC